MLRRGMENEAAAGIVVKRLEERNTLDVVPVEVGNEDVRLSFLVAELGAQALAQGTQTSPAVEDEDGVADAHLDAGGVPPITHVFGLGSWSRTTYPPEFDMHAPPDEAASFPSSDAHLAASMTFQ